MNNPHAAAGLGAGWKLVITAFFVALNGFFVAAEFALVKVRVSRLDALAQAGSRAARATMAILGNLTLYLSACQLGITISSLVLGWRSPRWRHCCSRRRPRRASTPTTPRSCTWPPWASP